MKYLRQDGYTLLLTLVLVVLLFLVTATFTVASMNQTKQIEKTDESFVATSLAEMGHEYFVTQIKKNIDKSYIDFVASANSINGSSSKTLNQKQSEISNLNSQYQTSITTYIESLRNKKIEIEDNSFYQLQDINILNNKINLDIIGVNNSNSKTVLTTLEIPLQTFSVTSSPNNPTEGANSPLNGLITPPNFSSLFPNPFPGFTASTPDCSTQGNDNKFKKNQECKTTNSNAINMLNGGEYYFTGTNLNQPVNHQNGSDSKLFIQNSTKQIVNFGNITGLSNTEILINGPAKFQNYEGAGNLVTHIKGDATFGHLKTNKDFTLYVEGKLILQNIDKGNEGNTSFNIYAKSAEWDALNSIENSLFSIEGDLNGKQVTDLKNKTSLFVGKNATILNLKLSSESKLIAESLSVDQMSDINNSRICAVKSISFKSGMNMDRNSKIYVLADTVVSSTISSKVTVVSKENFQTLCGVTFTPNNSTTTDLITNLTSVNEVKIDEIKYN